MKMKQSRNGPAKAEAREQYESWRLWRRRRETISLGNDLLFFNVVALANLESCISIWPYTFATPVSVEESLADQ